MKVIDVETLKTDESRSNPMVVALQDPECPINEICVYLVLGSGNVLKQCEHIKLDTHTADGCATCLLR